MSNSLNSEREEKDASPRFRENIDYGFLVKDAILTLHKSILATEYSEREIVEATKNIKSLITEVRADDQFKKAVKKAEKKKITDLRPLVTGTVRMSKEVCEELGLPIFKEEISYDYEKLREACYNFFDRNGLLSTMDLTEEIEGFVVAKANKDAVGENILSSE